VSIDPFSIIGVELGSRMENTSLSVTERTYVLTGEIFTETHRHGPPGRPSFEVREKVTREFRVRHLERFSPPVLYGDVTRRTAELVEAVGRCLIAIDITRMGRPAYDRIMRSVVDVVRGSSIKVTPAAVTISGLSGGVGRSPDAGWIVPRRDLVSAAPLLFEADQLKIAERLELAGTLTEEFVNFKPKEDPKDDLEGWRLAKNDDLVLAVAMSVWAAERFLRKEESVLAGGLGIPRAAG
jgi:hypothetical protein